MTASAGCRDETLMKQRQRQAGGRLFLLHKWGQMLKEEQEMHRVKHLVEPPSLFLLQVTPPMLQRWRPAESLASWEFDAANSESGWGRGSVFFFLARLS